MRLEITFIHFSFVSLGFIKFLSVVTVKGLEEPAGAGFTSRKNIPNFP